MQFYDKERLNRFLHWCNENKYFNVGYPESADFSFDDIKPFLDFSLNNCGDHEKYCNYALNSFDFEREVLDWFIRLFKGTPKDIYGYCTHGGTEGNMWGLWIAREMYPDGIVYMQKDAHYSAIKNIKILRMNCKIIEIDKYGVMNYKDLEDKLDAKKPAIIFASIGTTARGAIDDVYKIRDILNKKNIPFYIHADAALSGTILPFVQEPQPHTFIDHIDSITVCITKGFGSPIPVAVAMAKRENLKLINCEVDYIKSNDLTISGSRNGLTPLICWKIIKENSILDFQLRVERMINVAKYLCNELRNAGVPAFRHKNSITVVTPKASIDFVNRYKLAPFGDWMHIITSAHNSTETISKLLYELIDDYYLHALDDDQHSWKSKLRIR